VELPGAGPEGNTIKLPSTLAPLTFRKPSEILAMEFSDEANFLGDWMIAEEQPTTIVAPSGAGKSRLLLQMAADMILGRPFLGLETHAAGKPWLILGSENSNRRFKMDLEHLKAYHGDDWAKVDGCLTLHTVETEDDGYLSLANPANSMRIENGIRELDPAIVACDPLNEFKMGDLNSDDHMLNTCRELSRLSKAGNPKRACVVAHHTVVGRAGAVKAVGYDRGSYGRNSKALLGWTRAQINLAPGSPDNNEVLVVSCGKCSNGREFEPFAIRLNPETMIYELHPEFDLEAWLGEYGGQSKQNEPLVTIDGVKELCRGAMSRAELTPYKGVWTVDVHWLSTVVHQWTDGEQNECLPNEVQC
jgi:hypothetical protein